MPLPLGTVAIKHMLKAAEIRATDVLSKALSADPTVASCTESWGGLAMCEWRLPWLDGFEFFENDDFVIAYHGAGSRNVRAKRGGPWSDTFSAPGLVSVIPPRQYISYRVEGDLAFSTLHVPKRILDGLWRGDSIQPQSFRFAFIDPFVTSCMAILLNEAGSQRSCNLPYVHAVTRALLLHLLQGAEREHAQAAASSALQMQRDWRSKLNWMLDFIDANLAQELSLEYLAEQVGASRAHFARCFRSVMGMPPHQYVLLRRVERAKRLLCESDLELAEIALEAGFSNQSHFTTVFRSATGFTPTQHRRSREGLLT